MPSWSALAVFSAILVTFPRPLPAQELKRVAFFYGHPLPVEALSQFEQVVLEPANVTVTDLTRLNASGVTTFAYVSVGECNRTQPCSSTIDRSWVLGGNDAWNSDVMDPCRPAGATRSSNSSLPCGAEDSVASSSTRSTASPPSFTTTRRRRAGRRSPASSSPSMSASRTFASSPIADSSSSRASPPSSPESPPITLSVVGRREEAVRPGARCAARVVDQEASRSPRPVRVGGNRD